MPIPVPHRLLGPRCPLSDVATHASLSFVSLFSFRSGREALVRLYRLCRGLVAALRQARPRIRQVRAPRHLHAIDGAGCAIADTMRGQLSGPGAHDLHRSLRHAIAALAGELRIVPRIRAALRALGVGADANIPALARTGDPVAHAVCFTRPRHAGLRLAVAARYRIADAVLLACVRLAGLDLAVAARYRIADAVLLACVRLAGNWRVETRAVR